MKNILTEIPWRRLIKTGRPFWKSKEKFNAYLHLFSIFALMGTNIGLDITNNYLQGKVAKSIQQWNMPNITFYLGMSLLLVLVTDPVQVYISWFRTRLALIWRNWYSRSLFAQWYEVTAKPYFWITVKRKDVANSDQRMTQDPDSYANSTIGLLTAFAEAGTRIVSWALVLLTLSYMLTVTAVFCALVSSFVVIIIGKALVALTNQLMDTEAELRVSAGRAREGAEAIAFGRGEAVAQAQAETRVGRVIDTLMQIMNVNRNIQLFTTGWNLLMPLIPPAIMVYMSPGPVDYELIVRAGGAFTAFYNASNIFANQFGGLASYFAIINRLGVFGEAIEWAGKDPEPGKHLEVKLGKDIAFNDATILTADGTKVLLSKLNLRLEAGDSILVSFKGTEAPGKTSFLKTIAGIMNNGTGGWMERPPADQIMFLTPNPDVPTGSLREALSYPMVELISDDARLTQILNTVNLANLTARFGGFDTVQNWKELLSQTEVQRLVLARILLKKPKYVIIDEHDLDEQTERLLYTTLVAMGAIIISTGSVATVVQVEGKDVEIPSTLLRYTNKVLEIEVNGTWKLVPASSYPQPSPLPAKLT